MSIQNVINNALRDTRITTGTAYHTLMFIGQYAHENGSIGLTESGQPASDPEVIAAALSTSKPTIYRAFRDLEKFGYLQYVRARGNERATGVSGQVRILVAS